MNRRHFLALSGSALGSLLIHPSYSEQHDAVRILLPAAITVTLNDGVHTLQASGANHWTYQDIGVELKYLDDGLQVFISAVKTPVHRVMLDWKYAVPAGAAVLADHWERSYGDLQFLPADFNRRMPWYFVQHGAHETVCYGVKTGCAAICYWQTGNGTMRLTMDVRNGARGVQLNGRVLDTATIIATKSDAGENTFATARRFCSLMCEKPRLPREPVYGINDWYVTYGANSAQIILDHTGRMTDLAPDPSNRPFSVVDSGWAYYSPLFPNDCCWQDDYSRPNDHFKDMALLSQNIKKLGMRPGLWTRPLCAKHDDPQNRLLPLIPGRESAKKPVLDPSIPENLARIAHNISLYQQWGFELVKHDFTTFDIWGKWGFQMTQDFTSPGWGFNDPNRTTAEIVLTLYRTIRSAAKEMYLLGCNTFSHLSAGLFELNRIGDDTSGKEWERTKKMGVNTLGFRMVQHNKFYSADGDCVGLTSAVPWQKNRAWMRLLAESSSPLFISAQESATGPEQKDYIKQSFAAAAKPMPVAEPLDWLTNIRPEKWKLNGKEVDFDWG